MFNATKIIRQIQSRFIHFIHLRFRFIRVGYFCGKLIEWLFFIFSKIALREHFCVSKIALREHFLIFIYVIERFIVYYSD